MDKYVSGFISGFERRYSKLERAITTTISRTVLASPHRKRGSGKGQAASAAAPAQKGGCAGGGSSLMLQGLPAHTASAHNVLTGASSLRLAPSRTSLVHLSQHQH